MSKELAKTEIDLTSPAMVETLKKTVAQGATDEEFAMFAELCKATALNPFKREIWFIKAGGRAQIMTGINGYLTVANRHPQFDGLEVEIETDNQGNPTKATAKAHRKDRRFPSVGVALMKEFKKNTPIWSSMPGHMLAKVAKCIALREAFPQELAGTYTEEEMPKEYAEPVQNGTVKAQVIESLKSADELPVVGPKHRYYSTENVPEGKKEAARMYLDQNGATYDSELQLWCSEKRLAPMDKFEVKV